MTTASTAPAAAASAPSSASGLSALRPNSTGAPPASATGTVQSYVSNLRRLLERTADLSALTIDDVMSRAPRTVSPEALAVEALRLMEEHRITQVPVAEADRRLVGALHLHDLLAAKLA